MALKIPDYMARARPGGQGRASGAAGAGKEPAPSFSRLLADRLPGGSGFAGAGLTIADYLAQPVRGSKTHGRTTPLPSLPKTGGTAPEGGRRPLKGADAPPESGKEEGFRPFPMGPPVKEAVAPHTAPTEIEAALACASEKYAMPKQLIRAVIRAESNFKADAVSPAGAQGLMQLMPATAKALGVSDPFDIQQNIDGGSRYLRRMLDRFDGNLKLALAAYNAGPGTVARYKGQVPYPETVRYVARVMADAGPAGNGSAG